MKKQKVKTPSAPAYSDIGKWWMGELYPWIQKVAGGEGLLGDISLLDEVNQIRKEVLPQNLLTVRLLNRLLDPDDARTKQAVSQMQTEQVHNAIDDVKRQNILKAAEDQQWAKAMMTDMVANEKQMSTSIGSMYEQAAQNALEQQARYGTFLSNLGEGLGSMGGWWFGANSKPANPYRTEAPYGFSSIMQDAAKVGRWMWNAPGQMFGKFFTQ